MSKFDRGRASYPSNPSDELKGKIMYRLCSLIAIAFSVIQPALAQDFPTRQVRIIVGFPPGGGADLTARLI